LAQALAAGAAVAFGVDWSEPARRDGLARGIAVLTPDEFAAMVPDGSLDVLRYSHTLEHLPDPLGVLRAQLPKLRAGGLVYITQPCLPVPRDAPSAIEPHDSDWPIHLHFFNPLSFLRLAEAAGLRVERFFTVTDAEAGYARYRDTLDPETALAALDALRGRGEAARGRLNNHPHFTGFDAAMYLRAPGRSRLRATLLGQPFARRVVTRARMALATWSRAEPARQTRPWKVGDMVGVVSGFPY
jgi:SAM-dependent methyltransferase